MPNWCSNKLTIEDCSPELEQYLETEGLSFEKIDPNGTWGTKWDLSEAEQKQAADCLLSEECDFTAYFETAWSPPIQAIATLSKRFPNDSFVLDYCELGCGFAGTSLIQQGAAYDNEINDPKEVLGFAVDVFGFELDNDEP